MNRRETAEEPSMEDILASIRKIIADEPASAAASPLPLPQLSPAGFSPAAKETQPSFPAPQPSLTARLNDVFGPGSIVPGDRQDHASKPLPASRPVRSLMDDDLGDMLADAPPKPAAQPGTAAKPAPAVIAEPPARSRPFPLDSAAADRLSGRTSIPSPSGTAAGEASRFPLSQSSPYPPNTRLTELRTTPQAQPPASFDASPSFPSQTAPQPASPPQPEATRPAPVVIASMAPMEQRPLPAARPFSFAPGAPVAPSPAPSEPLTSRPEPTVLAASSPNPQTSTAPSDTVSFTPAPAAQVGPAAPSRAPAAQPSVAATIAPAASENQAYPTGISAATLDFLKPRPKQTDPVPASTLDFLKPAPKAVEPAPVAPAVPEPVSASPTAAPIPAEQRDADANSALPPAAAADEPTPNPSPVVPVAATAELVASEAVTSDPATPAAAEPAALDPSVASASALGALAAGLAASSRESGPEIIVSAVEVSPPKADTATQQDVPGVNTPVATATGVSVFSSPDSFVGGAHLRPISTSTLDDTAAELLRPMLRQWLDDNMPRIVERALRIELTDAVTVTAKTEPEK